MPVPGATRSLLGPLWDFLFVHSALSLYTTGCRQEEEGEGKKKRKNLHPVFSTHAYQADCLLRSAAPAQNNTSEEQRRSRGARRDGSFTQRPLNGDN